jgi:PKD repeat protein
VADTTNGNAAQVINPGGGFGFPTVWTSVQDPSTWAMVQQDLAFRLEGEVLPDVPWLSLDPAAGTLDGGMCMVPEATLDSTGLLPGDYTADLLLVSNDPFAPVSTVPVTFTVWAPAEVVDVSYVATYLVVDFDALVAGDEPLTFAWDFGDGNTSDLEDPTHTYAAGGCYDVVFTATNTCASDVWSDEVCVVAECEAVDGLAFTWMPETPLVGESVFFVASEPLTGTPPFTYTWDFGDGSGDVGQTANHAYGAADDYEVTLMVENACGEASIVETVTVEAGMHYVYLPIVVKNK